MAKGCTTSGLAYRPSICPDATHSVSERNLPTHKNPGSSAEPAHLGLLRGCILNTRMVIANTMLASMYRGVTLHVDLQTLSDRPLVNRADNWFPKGSSTPWAHIPNNARLLLHPQCQNSKTDHHEFAHTKVWKQCSDQCHPRLETLPLWLQWTWIQPPNKDPNIWKHCCIMSFPDGIVSYMLVCPR